jgi:hypothetical protein
LLPDCGVLIVNVDESLRAEDFDSIALTVDPWIDAHGNLTGVVIQTDGVPVWANVAAFVRHLRFVRDHHQKIKHLAIVADSAILKAIPAIVDPFVEAEVRTFDQQGLEAAIAWAAGHQIMRQPML